MSKSHTRSNSYIKNLQHFISVHLIFHCCQFFNYYWKYFQKHSWLCLVQWLVFQREVIVLLCAALAVTTFPSSMILAELGQYRNCVHPWHHNGSLCMLKWALLTSELSLRPETWCLIHLKVLVVPDDTYHSIERLFTILYFLILLSCYAAICKSR